ncbi:unnamed protein product [Parajaminaea phylloscopi]
MLLAQAPAGPGPLARAFAGRSQSASASSTGPHPLAALFSQASSGPIAIQNAKPPPPVKPNYAQQNVALVARSIRSLLAGEELETLSLEQLYALVDSLVNRCSAGPDLYERVQMEGQRAAVELARRLRDQRAATPSQQWLQTFAHSWKQWLARIQLVSDVLTPLHAGYIIVSRTAPSPVHDVLLQHFKEFVLGDRDIDAEATAATLQSVRGIRQGTLDAAEYSSVHAAVLAVYVRLDEYQRLCDSVLAETAVFYIDEAKGKAAASDQPSNEADAEAHQAPAVSVEHVEDYLARAQVRLDQEADRGSWLLLPADRQRLVQIARENLIEKQATWLAASLPRLLSTPVPPIAVLADLYRHLSLPKDNLDCLADVFFKFIVQEGAAIVSPPSVAKAAKIKLPPSSESDKDALRQAAADEEALIDNLLAFKRKVDVTVDEAFQHDNLFVHRRTDGFEKVVNSRTSGGKVAELCAKYLDAKLKSGNRTMTDEELERCLDEALALFRYTHAKDMFEEFYKSHFAKRLLLNRSASSDAEQSMLLRLKEECGAEFTHRLETMLKDITLSDDIMKGYASSSGAMTGGGGDSSRGQSDDFELHVNVLTQSQWPTYPLVEVRIPTVMAAAAERFRDFYSARNAGRRLHWAHSLGTCTVRAHFPRCGEKELHVSEFQAMVLLLFNDLSPGEKLGFTAIREQTGMEDVELRRTLQSLACGQIPTRVLRKEPQGREVSDTDLFHINEAFKNDRHRIRINQIQMKETKEEQASTEHKVLLDRGLVLQAAAVRILKARKQLKHSELLQEVVDSIKGRFQVDVGEIKKTFEILIEKEYMERVEGERGVYRYVA